MNGYVIFDIDGTLNQTDLYAIEAYQNALEKRGKSVEQETIISCIGLSPADIVERLFGSLEGEDLVSWQEEIKRQEFEWMDRNGKAFDGICEALEELKMQGYELAICSNAFPEHIERVLQVIGLRDYFKVIGSLRWGTNKGEVLGHLLSQIGNTFACMVGDRRFDLEAAKENGIPFVGCAYGYAPEEVRMADVIVEKPSEIPTAVAAIKQ